MSDVITNTRSLLLPSGLKFTRDDCFLKVLGAGSEYAQRNRLRDLLEDGLRQNVREMYENRAKAAALRAGEKKRGEEGKTTVSRDLRQV